jgi:hypothetical protein
VRVVVVCGYLLGPKATQSNRQDRKGAPTKDLEAHPDHRIDLKRKSSNPFDFGFYLFFWLFITMYISPSPPVDTNPELSIQKAPLCIKACA